MARIPRTSTQNRCTVTRRLCTHNESCGRGRDASAPLCGVLRARVRCARRRLALLAGAARWQVTHARFSSTLPARRLPCPALRLTLVQVRAGRNRWLASCCLHNAASRLSPRQSPARLRTASARASLSSARSLRARGVKYASFSRPHAPAPSHSLGRSSSALHTAPAADARITDACWRRCRAGVAASSRVWCCCACQRW